MRRFLLLLLFIATPAFAKSLYWNALNVTAQLDAEGTMHVKERQSYVFDGDWNGGERTFNIRLNQKLRFNGMTRIDDAGQEIPLAQGGLSSVDHWDFASSNVVRWRSRNASDPPFSNARIVYVLDYAIANVLQMSEDGHYVLDHNFVFPDRQGVIEHFTLDLSFDPAWNTPPIHASRDKLAPGESYVVSRELTFTGATPPAAFVAAPAWLKLACPAAIVLGMLALIGLFLLGEQPTGRFTPPPVDINQDWLRKNLFSMKPEVAGAAWDAQTGAPEVAAVLARLAAEGKITTRAEKKTLHMHLNQPLEQFSGYERDLLGALFVDGGSDTDTTRVKKHYEDRGFDPSKLIAPGIEQQMSSLPGRERVKRSSWTMFLIVLAIIAATALAAFAHSKNDLVAAAIAGGLTCFFSLASGGAAKYHSSALSGIGWRIFVVALLFSPGVIAVAGVCIGAGAIGLGMFTMLGLTLLVLACWKMVLNAMRITDSPPYIAFRQQLIAARNYFLAQLRSPQPQLHDDWLPYLLAFGLGTNVDRWFRSFGGHDRHTTNTFGSSGSSTSSTSSSSGWTGGGGTFGGAGATGTWAAAAGAMAAGVAAPSSSGSGGGGGGGSSGGGGGGGW